jgi:hypothetical protein
MDTTPDNEPTNPIDVPTTSDASSNGNNSDYDDLPFQFILDKKSNETLADFCYVMESTITALDNQYELGSNVDIFYPSLHGTYMHSQLLDLKSPLVRPFALNHLVKIHYSSMDKHVIMGLNSFVKQMDIVLHMLSLCPTDISLDPLSFGTLLRNGVNLC